MASITVTPNKHWLLYPLLIAALWGAIWLWRDTSNRDLVALKQAVETAKQAQVMGDKQSLDADRIAQATLAMKNLQLQKQLTAAKTVQQQVAVINQNEGTKIDVPPVDTPPDAPVPVSQPDLKQLEVKSVECAEDANQVAADQIQIAGDKTQIDSRDAELKAQVAEIKSLKGTHLKRFFSAAKHVGIGVGIGVVTGILIEKK
jgi:hypothetical protein